VSQVNTFQPEALARELTTLLGDQIVESQEFRGQLTFVVRPEAVLTVARQLREHGFDLLAALTAVDYWPKSPRFGVDYRLYSLRRNDFVGLRARLGEDQPELPSLEPVYPNANWHEREVFDMFGIRFRGHSDLRRILMPYEWVGHPLRKDYPLGYEEVQFSFNFDEIERRKKYVKD
jgi:NADH-quinone oxidoreductase subunit C